MLWDECELNQYLQKVAHAGSLIPFELQINID